MPPKPAGCLGILFAPFFKKPAPAAGVSFPFRKRDNFLSPAEVSLFHVLKRAIPTDYHLLTKVGLGDIFYVQRPHENMGARAKISQKHVDFPICEAGSMTPVLAVGLDDKSHQREDHKDRDAFVDGVFAAAGVPLLHIPAKRTYALQDVLELTAGHLQPPEAQAFAPHDGNAAEATMTPAPTPPLATADSSPPQCSKCESGMILHTASKGENKGKRFWGCTSYPKCRNVITID